jgi:hypothetical protein
MSAKQAEAEAEAEAEAALQASPKSAFRKELLRRKGIYKKRGTSLGIELPYSPAIATGLLKQRIPTRDGEAERGGQL